MNLFSLFSKKPLPVWSFSSPHTLWRVIFSTDGKIVCETRNTDNKTATFSCLEEKTGSVIWSNKTFHDAWWVGIEGISHGRLFLHGFKKPDMPEHLGIVCVDMTNGTEIWKNPAATFLTANINAVFGFKDLFERRVFFRLHPDDGTIAEEMTELPDDVEENIQLEKTDFTFPSPLMANDKEMMQIARSVEHIIRHDDSTTGGEFITAGAYIVLSNYAPNRDTDDGLKNTLSIIDRAAKKKVYSDVLNRSTPYPVPDSFFIDGNRVYYMKEKKSLVALDLPK